MASTMRPTSSLLTGPALAAGAPRVPAFVAVGLDAEPYARLQAALAGHAAIGRVDCWCQLALDEDLGRPCTAVFDPFTEDPGRVRELAARHPRLRLVGYARLTPACAGRLVEVLASGLCAFVTRDVDDTPAGFAYHLGRAGLLRADPPE
jgi:hypothetical protein